MQKVSEIYQLRKSGQLEEAYNLAYELYGQYESDEDVKKALAWVLVSLCKKNIEDNDIVSAKERFRLLDSLGMKGGDMYADILVSQIDFYRQRLSVWGELERMSKAGNEREAYDRAKSLPSSDLSISNATSYGWIIYRYLKKELTSIPVSEMNEILTAYLSLPVERPSLLHSQILMIAENYLSYKEHEQFDFLQFFKKWDPDNLRSEDLKTETKEINGRNVTFRSLAAKAMSLCLSDVKRTKDSTDIEWLSNVFDKFALEDDRWSLRQRAILYILSGNKPAASQIYRQQLKMPNPEYYLWYEAACCESDMAIRAGLLSKALTLKNKDEFLGNVRLAMADTFLKLEKPEAAAIELGKYHKLYESRQWNPNAKYNELMSKLETLGVPLGNPNRDNTELYRCYLPKSLEFVYSDLPIEHAIVDNVNENKQLFHVISLSGKTSIVYYRDTELRPNVGDILLLKYMRKVHKETGNVSWKVITMSEDNTGDNYGLKKEITSGRLKVSLGKNGLYGFVTEHDFSAYVPSYLLRKNGITSDSCGFFDVSAVAVLSGFPSKWTVIDFRTTIQH